MNRCPPGLAASASARSSTTVLLVGEAIETLQQRGADVTLDAIADETRRRKDGQTISKSAILRNDEAHQLFTQACSHPRSLKSRRKKVSRRDAPLMRLSKAELVARVRRLEGKVAHLTTCLTANAFAAFPSDEDVD